MSQRTENDLSVLFPDQPITLSGQTLTVRELRFGEQLLHHAQLKPLADAFIVLAPRLNTEEVLNHVLDLLADHIDPVLTLVAVSCSPVDALPTQIEEARHWISQLPSHEGEALLLTWWTVNQGFFARRLLRPLQVARERARTGAASSPNSLPLDTDTPTSSTTPVAN